MKIAISNIAWDKLENAKILQILKSNNIQGIEISPTKIWKKPLEVNPRQAQNYKNFWKKNGIEIVAMQSLLYGHPELKIFQSQEIRNQTVSHLEGIIKLASFLDVPVLVFGSPGNRKKGILSSNETKDIALNFFGRLGDIGQKYNVCIGLEAIPPIYGCDFVNTTSQALDLVKSVNNPNFQLHIDAGTMTINRENIENSIESGFPFLKHMHLAEKDFEPLQEMGALDHKLISLTLTKLGYSHWVSIEMREGENNPQRVTQSLQVANKYYL